MKKRELDLEALEAVAGGINLRTLQTHLGDSHAAPIGGGDPLHAGPQFNAFGTHPVVPGAFPNALHAPAPLPQIPHAPAPVAHAPAPAPHAPAQPAFNPASAIQSISGLINSLSKLGGGGSSSSGGSRGQSGNSGSSSGQSQSGSGFGQSFGDFDRAGQSGSSSSYSPAGHAPGAADPYSSRELDQFTQQDNANRANGYYGAFGDAPTGPSASQLNQFTQQDNANRANGYYGAFGDAPTGPSASQLNEFTQQDAANRANGYYGAFGDAPTGTNNGFSQVQPPQYPTEAPNIDTTGVQQIYSDDQLQANRDSLSNYQDAASPPDANPVGSFDSNGLDAPASDFA